MFSSTFHTMLYVDDVATEKEFWTKMGFIIVKEDRILDFPTFEMKVSPEAECSFVVYDKAFIQAYSPDLLTNKPNLLFFTDHIDMVYKLVQHVSPTVSDLNIIPFKNFSFESPSGHFFTVRETL